MGLRRPRIASQQFVGGCQICEQNNARNYASDYATRKFERLLFRVLLHLEQGHLLMAKNPPHLRSVPTNSRKSEQERMVASPLDYSAPRFVA